MTTDGMRRVRLSGNLYRPIVPAGAVRITRPTRWGNPYPVRRYGLVRALTLHREWLLGTPAAVEEARAIGCRLRLYGPALADAARHQLDGRVLACWCPFDAPCHGDLLLAVASTVPGEPVPTMPWESENQGDARGRCP